MRTSGLRNSAAVAIGRSAPASLLVHVSGKLQILPRLALVRRGTQEIGGIIRDHERRVEFPEAMYLAAQAAQRRIGCEQILGGDAPDREQDLRPQQRDLTCQVGQAGGPPPRLG